MGANGFAKADGRAFTADMKTPGRRGMHPAQNLRAFTIFLLLLVAGTSCRKPSADPGAAQTENAVNVSNGISQAEAEVIARRYFAEKVGCGAFAGIRDGVNRWIVEGQTGYSGDPVQGSIDKRSGKFTPPISRNNAIPATVSP